VIVREIRGGEGWDGRSDERRRGCNRRTEEGSLINRDNGEKLGFRGGERWLEGPNDHVRGGILGGV
jgi:hypothetical protein